MPKKMGGTVTDSNAWRECPAQGPGPVLAGGCSGQRGLAVGVLFREVDYGDEWGCADAVGAAQDVSGVERGAPLE